MLSSAGRQSSSAGAENRRGELARLQGVLDDASPGAPRVVEIVGDPGIGKTRLLGELAAMAERAGRVVVWGRAAEFERQVPFGIVTDALEDHVTQQDPARLAGLTSADVGLLRAVFPELPAPGVDAAPRALIEAERYRLYRSMRALLEVVARPSGLVLVLDDLHWADEGSAELLDYLLRHPPRGPVLVAVAHRPRQMPGRLRQALARAVHDGLAELLEVSPLTPEEAAELLSTGVAPTRRAELYASSGGNPLYLQALARGGMRDLRGAGPGGDDADGGTPAPVWAALSAEFAVLPPTELVVAQAAAVAGESVEPELIARAAERGLDTVLAALDGLADRDLIRPVQSGGRFCFRHPLVRTVAYELAGAGWRIAAHARASAALRERGAPAAEQAHHVERSAQPGDRQAIDVLRKAATSVMHSTPATAAHWLQAALRLLPEDAASTPQRLELLVMHARALGVTGRFRESRDTLHQLLRLLPAELGAPRAQIVAFSATIERLLGRHAEAHAVLLAELTATEDPDGPAALALKLGLATGVVLRSNFHTDRDWPREALATARHNPNRPLLAGALAMCVVADHLAEAVDQDTVKRLDEAAALLDALPDGELAQGIEMMGWVGSAELCHERIDDAIRHSSRVLAVARASGQSHVVSYLHGMLGSAHALLGNHQEATDCFDNEFDAAVLTGSYALRGTALEHQCWLAMWRGDLEHALRLGKEAVASADNGKYLISWNATAMLAVAHLLKGDPATCVDLLLRAGGGPELPTMDPVSRITWYETLAEAHAVLGRFGEAAGWADRAERAASQTGLPRRMGFARLARVHALLRTDPASAVPHAHAAAESLSAAGDRVAAGRAHAFAGVALAAIGEGDLARAEFAQARQLFEVCGAPLLLQQTIREERRMNARQPRKTSRRADPATDGTADSGLTPRERQVAELVAEGLTNKEIAERLYLSPGTVNIHLGRIYAKLGVSRRAAVVGRLTRPPR